MALMIVGVMGLGTGGCRSGSLLKGQPFEVERPVVVTAWDVTDEHERQLGNHTDAVIQRNMNILDAEHPLARTVDRIGQRLAGFSDRPGVTYRFRVINDPTLATALAVPGGFIYVTTALMRLVESEDELAAAIAHEIAHVVARHSIEDLKRRQRLEFVVTLAADAAAAVAAGAVGGALPGASAAGGDLVAQSAGAIAGRLTAGAAGLLATLVLRAHDRDQEREADQLALRYLERAGYRGGAGATLFCRLEAVAARDGVESGGLLSTHPSPEERCRLAPAAGSGRSR